MSDNELDNLFKEAADGFKPPQDPAAWQDMSRRLDEVGPATTAAFWNWKVVSSLIVVGITGVAVVWYLSQQSIDQPLGQEQAATMTPESKPKVVPLPDQSSASPSSSADQQEKVKAKEETALREEPQASLSQQKEIQTKTRSNAKASEKIGLKATKATREEKQAGEIVSQQSTAGKDQRSAVVPSAAVTPLGVEKTSTREPALQVGNVSASD
ncbi:MAG TPA: hypothetical protein VGK46_07445, partial [Saprospiraceae bacterium]